MFSVSELTIERALLAILLLLTLQVTSGCSESIPLHKTVSKWIFWWIQSWPNFLTFHIHVLGSQWYHFWCYWLSKSVKNHVFLSANLGIHSLRTTQMTANLLWLKYFKPAYRLLQNLFNPNFLLQSLITNVGKYLQIDVGF